MRTIESFDPTSSMQGTIDVSIVNKCGKFTLYNESNIGIILTFPDGDTANLPAWWARTYKLRTSGISSIDWQQTYTLNSASAPISRIYGEAYEASEEAPDVNVALGRLTNIGNAINTVANMIASNVVNDNNPVTDVVEATLTGSSGSNILIKNDGSVTIKEFVSGVLTQLFQIIPNASTAVKIAALGKTLEILGSALIDQNATITGNLTVDGTATLPTITGGVGFNDGVLTNINKIQFSATQETKIVNSAGIAILLTDNGDVDINVPSGAGNFFRVQFGGVSKLRLDTNGDLIIDGGLTQNGNP